MTEIKYQEEFEAAFKKEIGGHRLLRLSKGEYKYISTADIHCMFVAAMGLCTEKAKRLDAVIAYVEEKLAKTEEEDEITKYETDEYQNRAAGFHFGVNCCSLKVLKLAKGESDANTSLQPPI